MLSLTEYFLKIIGNEKGFKTFAHTFACTWSNINVAIYEEMANTSFKNISIICLTSHSWTISNPFLILYNYRNDENDSWEGQPETLISPSTHLLLNNAWKIEIEELRSIEEQEEIYTYVRGIKQKDDVEKKAKSRFIAKYEFCGIRKETQSKQIVNVQKMI